MRSACSGRSARSPLRTRTSPGKDPPFPFWQDILRNTMHAAEEGALDNVPVQWLTAKNEPRCVRCGTKLSAEERLNLLDAGSCLRVGACFDVCRAEVQRFLLCRAEEE
jgi:hypothetical protein